MTMGILVRIISEVYHIPSPSVVCNKGAHGHTGVIMGIHTDVCISEGGGVTRNDAYIRQGRKMMPLET